MPKSVLFVTHDRGPGKFGPPIARKLQELGHTVFVTAAGPSVESWEQAGFQTPTFRNPEAVNNEQLNEQLIETLVHQFSVIVLGMSSPSRFEWQFGEVVLADRAAGHGTPLLVGIVDAWGAYHRMPPLDAYLTLDGLDPAAIKATHSLHWKAQTFVMGDLDPAVNVPNETRDLVESILARHKYVFQLAGQKWPATRDIFRLALMAGGRSLTRGENLAFIESIHPGAEDAVKVELNGMLDVFNGQHSSQRIYRLRNREGKPLNGDHVAHLVKKVIAATGTALRIAAYDPAGIPICAWSPDLAKMIMNESGTLKHPLSGVGAAIDLIHDSEGLDLAYHKGLGEMIRYHGPQVIARKGELGLTRVPFNPEGAARFIASL